MFFFKNEFLAVVDITDNASQSRVHCPWEDTEPCNNVGEPGLTGDTQPLSVSEVIDGLACCRGPLSGATPGGSAEQQETEENLLPAAAQ